MSSPKDSQTLAAMRRAGVPLTRENYISWAFMLSEDEAPLDAELEAELPEMFRREAVDPPASDRLQ